MERHHFETELAALRNQLLTMGGLVEERVHRAIQSLIHRKEEEARRIIATDKEINDLQIDIDDRCLKLLATQTPLAIDLRLITSAMKINAEQESRKKKEPKRPQHDNRLPRRGTIAVSSPCSPHRRRSRAMPPADTIAEITTNIAALQLEPNTADIAVRRGASA